MAATRVSVAGASSAASAQARGRLSAVSALTFIAFVGVAYLREQLLFGSFPVDIPLALLVVFALYDMTRRSSAGSDLLRALWPWVWLVICASFAALIDDGLPEWAAVSLAKTAFAMLFFPATLHVIEVGNLRRIALRGAAVGLGVTLFGLLFVHDFYVRPRAFFEHPNYAAHYCFVAGAVIFFHGETRRGKTVGLVTGLFGIYLTSSFGGIAMVIAAFAAYLVIKRPRHLIPILALAAFPTLFYVADNLTKTDDFTVNQSLSTDRFEISRGGRIEIWADMVDAWRHDPLGYGPDGTNSKDIGGPLGLESHSDWLGFLCERGPLGFIGLIGIWGVLWRFAPKRSASRVLMVALMVAGLLRETMNYRHMWLLLALCLSYDLAARRRGEELRLATLW